MRQYLRICACACYITDKVMVHIEGGIGCVDILLSPTTACLYIANNEVTLTQDTRSKLISLSKVYRSGHCLVVS